MGLIGAPSLFIYFGSVAVVWAGHRHEPGNTRKKSDSLQRACLYGATRKQEDPQRHPSPNSSASFGLILGACSCKWTAKANSQRCGATMVLECMGGLALSLSLGTLAVYPTCIRRHRADHPWVVLLSWLNQGESGKSSVELFRRIAGHLITEKNLVGMAIRVVVSSMRKAWCRTKAQNRWFSWILRRWAVLAASRCAGITCMGTSAGGTYRVP